MMRYDEEELDCNPGNFLKRISPMSRDGFHEMVAVDLASTGKEIAKHGRMGKSKPDPSRLKAGKLKSVPSRFFFFF